MFAGDDWLLNRMLLLIPLILSLSVHEWAHAASARWLGDDTAERLGRLTMNPLAHIDPVGTLLLPLIGVPFGWAKPVPFNPIRFRRSISMKMGSLIVAAAGPASNIVLAVICVPVLAVVDGSSAALTSFLQMMIFLNVILAVFNLFPIPPLDGSHIADALMPKSLRPAWEAFAGLGPIALFVVIAVPFLIGFNLFSWPIEIIQRLLSYLAGV